MANVTGMCAWQSNKMSLLQAMWLMGRRQRLHLPSLGRFCGFRSEVLFMDLHKKKKDRKNGKVEVQ